jgi:hypothetical protein
MSKALRVAMHQMGATAAEPAVAPITVPYVPWARRAHAADADAGDGTPCLLEFVRMMDCVVEHGSDAPACRARREAFSECLRWHGL